MTILDKVNAPADLKKLSAAELTELAQDVRGAVLNKVSQSFNRLWINSFGMLATKLIHIKF